MLTALKTHGFGTHTSQDAVSALEECHGRIRHFSALAVTLATVPDAPPEQVSDAATRVHRYFSIALPLHVLDEEESFRPRLEAVAGMGIRSVLKRLGDEHVQIEALLVDLLTTWLRIKSDPVALAGVRSFLVDRSSSLKTLLAKHLILEEQEVFPAYRRHLSIETLEMIADEMQGRRRPA